MAGSKNDVVVGKNADFSQAGAPNAATSEANGLATNGQLWIGTTALNAGGTHINVGTISSPNNSITVGYVSPNITLQVTGGSTVGQTITGDTGGALSPTAGNWNLLGSGSITTSGAGSTLTTQLTGLTNHAVLVGAGTTTITKVGPTATAGQVLQSSGAAADPAFSTATYPATTTINQVLYSSANNTVAGITAANNGTMISGTTGVPSWLANGTTGQVLTATTGSPPSWTSPASGFSSVVIQFFNSGTPTYTPTSGMKFCIVEVIGGGGGGGGANSTGAGQVSNGGGGGGGGYARGVFTAAEIGASVSITIGAGGTAGANTGGNGGQGGTTIFGALTNATGGFGGIGGGTAAVVSTTLGGAGGVGSPGTGDFATIGSAGTNGAGSFAAGFAKGGTGGCSYICGGGGVGACVNTGRAAGAVGSTYGGGGGGSAVMASQTGFAGGVGGIGCVIVTEFI